MENIIKEIIYELCSEVKSNDHRLNERYIHHYFSGKIQKHYPIALDGINKGLHPEWPTCKQTAGTNFGRYKCDKDAKIYNITDEGSSVFIDFCIGDYSKPDIAIEFMHKFGWSQEYIVFDYLKLLDSHNPFSLSFSVVVISREKELSRGNHSSEIESRINESFDEAKRRLGTRFDEKRKFFFYIVEHCEGNDRRRWYLDHAMTQCRRCP